MEPQSIVSFIVTVPKTVSWTEYKKELETVKDGGQVLRYKTRYFPKEMSIGDRLYIYHDGYVRGYMLISGLIDLDEPWVCTTTGQQWPSGKYIERTGEFLHLNTPVSFKGFRGVRRYAESEL